MDMNAPQTLAAAVELYNRGEKAQAERLCRELLKADPGFADAHVLRGVICSDGRRWDESIAAFERALALKPATMAVQEKLIAVLGARSIELFAAGRSAEAVPCLRRLLDFHPHDPTVRNYLTDVLGVNKMPAVLADYTKAIRPEDLGRHLFVACMPKSGSTFLSNCLVRLTGFTRTFHSFAYMQNEEELYLPSLVRFARYNMVTQQHCRATAANLQLMQAFAIRPVVLIRRLDDAVMSLLDFYDSGGAANTTFLNEDYPRLTRAERIDALIDLKLPWYVEFYVSWTQAERDGRVPMLWLTYKEMTGDKMGALARVAQFYGLGSSEADIRGALDSVEQDPAASRFNKGVIGRGEAGLTKAQKDRIRRLFRAFPSVDFAPIAV